MNPVEVKTWIGTRWVLHTSTLGECTTIVPSRALPAPEYSRSTWPVGVGATGAAVSPVPVEVGVVDLEPPVPLCVGRVAVDDVGVEVGCVPAPGVATVLTTTVLVTAEEEPPLPQPARRTIAGRASRATEILARRRRA